MPSNAPGEYRFDLQLFDHTCKRVTEDHPSYQEARSVMDNYMARKTDENAAFLATYEIDCESPSFEQAVGDARAFLGSIGLVTDVDFRLIDGAARTVLDASWQASYSELLHDVRLYADKLIETEAKYGARGVTAILVHEGAHSVHPRGNFGISNFPDKTPRWLRRSGFKVMKSDGETYGSFYEEGFAEYVAGLYQRRLDDPNAGLVSLQPGEPTPSLELPEHYRSDAQVAGFDGYAIELLAYGLEYKGIAEADVFINALLACRQKSSQVESLRTVVRLINTLRPGLYSELQDLRRSREAWQHGLAIVHSASTQS